MNSPASPRSGGASLRNGPRQLRLVEPSSEQMLRDLFECEDDLLTQLHRVTLAQKAARKRYADERGLLILPGFETLRKAVGK